MTVVTGPVSAAGLDAPAACRFESAYAAERESVPRARHEVEEFLSGCRRAADAGLIITELAANALFHSASRNGGKFTVRVKRHPAFLYLGVQDAGGPWGEATEDSHGLDIIRALCGRDGWGRVELDDGGRIVWALLPVSERAVLEARRVAFSEANPGVHFASPRDNRDGLWAAWWTDSNGNHQVQYPAQEELLDDLEKRFGLTPSRARVSLSRKKIRTCASLPRCKNLPVATCTVLQREGESLWRGIPGEAPVTSPRGVTQPRSRHVAGVSLNPDSNPCHLRAVEAERARRGSGSPRRTTSERSADYESSPVRRLAEIQLQR